jgi:hypothetical protein
MKLPLVSGRRPTPNQQRQQNPSKLQTRRYSCGYAGDKTSGNCLRKNGAVRQGRKGNVGRVTNDGGMYPEASAEALDSASLRRQASDTSLAESSSSGSGGGGGRLSSSSTSALDPVIFPSPRRGRPSSASPHCSTSASDRTAGRHQQGPDQPRTRQSLANRSFQSSTRHEGGYERSQSLGQLLSKRCGGLKDLGGRSGSHARSYRSLVNITDKRDSDNSRRTHGSNQSCSSAASTGAATTTLASATPMLLLPAVLAAVSSTTYASSMAANVYDITPPKRSLARRSDTSVVEVTVHSPTIPSRRTAPLKSHSTGPPSPTPPPISYQAGAAGGSNRHADPPQQQLHGRSYDPTRLPLYGSLRLHSRRSTCCRRRGSAIHDVLEDCEAAERLRREMLRMEKEDEQEEDDDAQALSASLREFLLQAPKVRCSPAAPTARSSGGIH